MDENKIVDFIELLEENKKQIDPEIYNYYEVIDVDLDGLQLTEH